MGGASPHAPLFKQLGHKTCARAWVATPDPGAGFVFSMKVMTL